MTVENVSSGSFATRPDYFTLTSAEGGMFKPLETGFHIPSPSFTTLDRGGRSSEPAVFEVPSASSGFVLSYQPAGLPEFRFAIPSPDELPIEP